MEMTALKEQQSVKRMGSSPGGSAAEAVSALVDAAGGRLHGMALRVCGNAADAEDMVQDVFLQAYRKWHTFRGEADPVTWLFAIAGRMCKGRRRRRGGTDRRVPAMSQLMPWTETRVMEIAAAQEGADDAASKAEAVRRVQEQIPFLPEHLRLPLIMKDVLELSVEETAEALGLAENTLKTRVHRARLALRKAMTEHSRRVPAPPPSFEKQVCLDLLKAKLEAIDRGGTERGFAVPQGELCARCRAVFRELDLVQSACAQLGARRIPKRLRAKILVAIKNGEKAARAREGSTRRGRRPVRGKRGNARGVDVSNERRY